MRLIRLLKRDLLQEIRLWQQDNLISTEQAEKISARYGIDYHDHSQRSYGYYILVGLGYLFLGLSVLVVIGENWQEIPRGVRMSGLIMLTVLVNLSGIYRFAQGNDGGATVLLLLGSLLYGTSIMLIAQIYHLGEHYPDGILWWVIGVMPLALFAGSISLMLLATVLSFTWFFVEASLNYYPWLFPVFLSAIGWFLYRIRQSILLFLALVAGVGLWGANSISWLLNPYDAFSFSAESVVFVFGYFLVLHGLARWLFVRENHFIKDYGAILSLWVLRFVLVTLLIMSFEIGWEGLARANWEYPSVTLLVYIILCVTGLWLLWRSGLSVVSNLFYVLVSIVVLGVLLFTDSNAYTEWFQVLDNIVLMITGIWLIIRGIHAGISQYFYAGIVTILLTGLFRYIDLIGNYIGAAILFGLFALILLFAARFWRMHQQSTGETV